MSFMQPKGGLVIDLASTAVAVLILIITSLWKERFLVIFLLHFTEIKVREERGRQLLK